MSGRRHLWAFAAAEALLVLVDVVAGTSVQIGPVYAVPVLVLALVERPAAVVTAALTALLLAAGSGIAHGTFDSARHAVRMLVVAGAGAAACAFAVVRERLGAELQRLRRLASENAELVSGLQTKERELAGVVAAIADAVLVHDASGRSLYANQAAADVLGLENADAILRAAPGEIPARFEFTGEDGRPLDPDLLPGRRIFAGELDPPDLLARSVHRDTGRERWTVTKASAVRGPDGEPLLAVNVIEDVTESRRRSEAAELLAAAGDVLGGSLELPTMLSRLAALAVPQLADWCSVDLPAGRDIVTTAIAHVRPERAAGALELLRRFPAHLDDEYGPATVLRGGPTLVLQNLDEGRLGTFATDPDHRTALAATGICHLMVVGMRAGDATVGTLNFVRGRDRRPFGPEEVQLAEELARRAGTAVLNARLYQERTAVANTLQRSLLPPELPEADGLAMAAHYRPSGGLSEVGGDFYDAFPLADGWLVAIGDVTGKGAAAAALTGLARSALEAVATLTGRPSLALAHLHGLLARRGDMAIASVAALHIHAGPAPVRVSVLSAGHPPPLLLRDGRVEPIEATGPLLGAFADQEWEALDVELEPGDVIVLRTDGVTDAVGADGRLGEERLHEALVGCPAGDAAAAVARVRERVEAHQAGEGRDDVAIVAVALTGPEVALPPPPPGMSMPSLATSVVLDGTAASVARARAAVDGHLFGVVSERVLDDARLLVSELASNAVKHAGGGGYVLALDLDPHRLRVELADRGPGPVGGTPRSARGALPEGGYGLGIVERLATRWGVERGGGHHPTRVWFELARD